MQRTTCGPVLPWDDPAFVTDRAAQEEAVRLIADVVHASVRATLFDDRDSVAFLTQGLAKHGRVLKAVSNAACFRS